MGFVFRLHHRTSNRARREPCPPSEVAWSQALSRFAAVVLLLVREPEPANAAAKTHKSEGASAPLGGMRLLMSPPILLNLVFFMLLAFCGGGLNNNLVVSLAVLYETPAAIANTALTASGPAPRKRARISGLSIVTRRTVRRSCPVIVTATSRPDSDLAGTIAVMRGGPCPIVNRSILRRLPVAS